MEDIDQKIKDILEKLRKAHKESEKHYARQITPGEPIIPQDIYPMALAFDNEKKILLELDLARSEKYPSRYSQEEVENIRKEIDQLSFNIKAWEHRKFPCEYKGDDV